MSTLFNHLRVHFIQTIPINASIIIFTIPASIESRHLVRTSSSTTEIYTMLLKVDRKVKVDMEVTIKESRYRYTEVVPFICRLILTLSTMRTPTGVVTGVSTLYDKSFDILTLLRIFIHEITIRDNLEQSYNLLSY